MALEDAVSGGAIDTLLSRLDQLTHTLVFQGYAALSDSLAPTLSAAVIAYIAFVGWGSLQGWHPFSVGQAAKHALKIAITFTLATQWNLFSLFVYTVFTQGPNELSAVLIQATHAETAPVNTGLQHALDAGMEVGDSLWNLGGLSLKLAGFLVWLFTWGVIGIALFELTVAKFGLAITLTLAPLVSLFLLSKTTKPLCDGWLRVALGFALVPLFLTAVLLLVTTLLQESAQSIQVALGHEDITLSAIVPFLLSGTISTGLVFKAAQMAATMANGLALSAEHMTKRSAHTVGRAALTSARWAAHATKTTHGAPRKP